MDMPKVSIIIPVFNAESSIVKCVDSVLDQQYQNLECIIINDGSTDETDMICRSISLKHDQVKYIKTTNMGVSHARNLGIEISTGEYIVFVDADDYLLEDSIAARIEKTGANSLCICGYCKDTPENRILIEEIVDDDLQVFLQDLFYMKFYGYQGYIWNKIFYAPIIRNNNIRFNEEIYYNEDRLFVFEYVLKCSRVFYINKCLYCYVQSNGGAMYSVRQNKYNYKQITELTAYNEMYLKAPSNRIKNSISFACFNSCCELLERVPCEDIFRDDKNKIIKIRNKHFWHYVIFAWHIDELRRKYWIVKRMIVDVFRRHN